ncbi:FHA domain-containing protein [Nocardioides humilatus]|uniref:FHA domain-containing protein n=1 Tax=Nocardioides humilatus TaxID=2607660 RepID=A0A5B1L444_9ACTN|nr:FHA domain-containing protein [Nocardioides humilatus]KAA1415423.1 FHA domain-containing protein [Nocardioides humilatus]
MTPLQIEAGGQSFMFDGTKVVTIGRDPNCDITLMGGTVSRQHAEIRPDATGWTLVDTGSSSGTFHHGTQVSEVRLTGQGTLRIGGLEGEQLTYSIAGARPAAPLPEAALPAPGLQQTIVPGGAVPGSFVPGPALLVRTGGQSKRFVPGTMVRIGRDPANEVVTDDAAVSRLHAVVESRPDGWWYVDRSTAGTFDGEDRVTAVKVIEPLTLMLGHPTAGIEVEVVPIVDARQAQKELAGKKRKRTAALVGGIVGGLVIVGGGVTAAVVLAGGDDEKGGKDEPTAQSGLTTEELTRAKLATVLIIALDANGEVTSKGSGAIVSEDGKILTAAHVGDPTTPGALFPEEGEGPSSYQIALVSAEDDKPAAPEYIAEPVVSDGPLDLTIMQITGDVAGNPIAPADLDLPEPLALGNIDDVHTGDSITALGFPGVAHVATTEDFTQNALTVTRGVVSTFLGDEPIDPARAWIDSDVRIGSGNSGGPSINDDGEIIGINDNVVTDMTVGDSGAGGSFTGGSARLRPVNFAEALLAAAQQGTDYVSPYLGDVPEQEVPGQATIEALGWASEGSQGCAADTDVLPYPPGEEPIYAEWDFRGVPEGTTLSLTLVGVDGSALYSDSIVAGGTDGCFSYQVVVGGVGVEGIDAVLTGDGGFEVHNQVTLQ